MEMSIDSVFKGLPPGCPPSDARAAEGTMYRLVGSDPPTSVDFLTHAELAKALKANPCSRCGLSVFSSLGDVIKLYARVASQYGPESTGIGHLVARLELEPMHGKMLADSNKSTHHNWWPYDGVNRLSTFKEIVEDARDALET